MQIFSAKKRKMQVIEIFTIFARTIWTAEPTSTAEITASQYLYGLQMNVKGVK